jgi:dTDP-4-amino-4,6-dideoxygalactose transaminase
MEEGEFLVPMSSPDLTKLEKDAVAEVMDTPWLSMGPREKGFEAAVRDYVGARHALAVSSGTAGLHLCVRSAGIQDGDWVLTTPFSFVSSSNVILYERALPVFVDVDPVTGNIDPDLLAQALQDLAAGGKAAQPWLPRKGANQGTPRAILSVDVFGQPAEYERIHGIAREHDLTLIEDSCEAIGAEYRGQPAGSFGDGAVFAFYPNKQITTGEGGVVVTDRDDWAEKVRALRNQGRAPGDTWLNHTYLGYNYRMNELSAALGLAQMARIDDLIMKRERVAQWYAEGLVSLPAVEPPQVVNTTTRMSWFVYVVRFDPSLDRDRVMALLREEGIPSRPYFAPIHLQRYMQERFGYRRGDFPITEDFGARSLALPFSSVMSKEQVGIVCDALRQAIERA